MIRALAFLIFVSVLACALAAANNEKPLEIGNHGGAWSFNDAEAPEPPASAYRNISLPTPYMIDNSTLAYVECGRNMGTAVQISQGRYITAAHVATMQGCRIGDKPIFIESVNANADWAIIKSEAHLPFYVIYSCDRLVMGQSYFATGYAEGNPWPVTTRLVAEDYHDSDGASYSRGALVSGMSGGAVVDADGVLHAINDSYTKDGIPLTGVVEIADTPLCKGKK